MIVTWLDGGDPSGVAVLVEPMWNELHGMKRWLLVLFALAFGIRLAFGLLVAADMRPASDVGMYREMATHLAAGDGLSRQAPVARGSSETELRPTAAHPPLHPVLLAVADRFGGGSMGAQRVVLSVVGALGVVAGAWGVAGLTDRRVGIVAGFIAAVNPLRFQLPGMLVSEAAYLAVLGGLVVAAAFAVERRSVRSMVVLGGVAGLAALTRAEAILVVGFVALPVAAWFGWRRLGAPVVLVTVASAAAVVAPWMVRNAVVMGTPQISLNGGATLAGSNCEETYAGERLGGFSLNCAVGSAMSLYANPSPTDTEKDRAGRDLAISFARAHRGDVPKVVAARVGRSLGVFHRADALDFDVAEGRSRPWQRVGIGLRILLLPLAIAGAVVAHRRRMVGALMVSLGLTAVALVTSASVYGSTRMGLTLQPGETLLASIALVALADRIRPGRAHDSDGGATDATGSLLERHPRRSHVAVAHTASSEEPVMARWAAGAASSVLRRARSVPLAVWAVTALVGALGIFHSFMTPLAAAPDENTHADMIFWLAEGNAYPEFDGRLTSRTAAGVVYSLNNSKMFPNTPEKVAAVRDLMVEPFGRLGPDDPRGPEQYNQMAQHPPLYYESAKALVRADRKLHGGATGWFGEWHRLRIASFAPMVALPLLAWAATRRIGGSSEAAVAASVFILAVPQLFHITSALNNDTYLAVFGAIVAWLLAGVIRDGPRRSGAAAIGLFVGLALLTKAFALVFPPWVAVVYARRARRHRDELGRSARDLAIAGAVALAVAGWWWIGNLLRHGTPAPTTEAWLYTSAMQPPGFEPDPGWFVARFVAWMPRRFFGWFGWFSAPMGLAFVVVASAITAGAVAYAFGRRQQGVSRFDLAALLSVVPMLLVFVAVRAWSLYTTTGRTPFIQGRYLFAGFVPLAVAVGVGAARALGRRAPLVLVVGAILMQGAALPVMLRAFWGAPDDSWSERVAALRAWNPGLVDPLWWFVGAVLPLTLLSLVLLVAFARQQDDGPAHVLRRRADGRADQTRTAWVHRGAAEVEHNRAATTGDLSARGD